MEPLTCGNFVDMITYKDEYPIFYFDVSKQSERLNDGVVDIMIRIRFRKETPKLVQAHALLISDLRVKFKSDCTKMNIIYLSCRMKSVGCRSQSSVHVGYF